MFWKNGIEYRGVDPVGGESTRWDVARVSPLVTISSAARQNVQRLATEIHKYGTNILTFADINNESSRNGRHVNPSA
jgi:hypothetical protein